MEVGRLASPTRLMLPSRLTSARQRRPTKRPSVSRVPVVHSCIVQSLMEVNTSARIGSYLVQLGEQPCLGENEKVQRYLLLNSNFPKPRAIQRPASQRTGACPTPNLPQASNALQVPVIYAWKLPCDCPVNLRPTSRPIRTAATAPPEAAAPPLDFCGIRPTLLASAELPRQESLCQQRDLARLFATLVFLTKVDPLPLEQIRPNPARSGKIFEMVRPRPAA